MAEKLAEGDKAPSFKLPTDSGEIATLADFKGRKLVIFFYPKADTPGCTTESIAFSKLRQAFAKADTAIIGVSPDPVKAQCAFRDKHGLKVPLIADEKYTMAEAYGVWGEKSLYGRKFMGVTRTTFLIDAAGRIAHVWPKVKVDGHAEEVLAAAKAL